MPGLIRKEIVSGIPKTRDGRLSSFINQDLKLILTKK